MNAVVSPLAPEYNDRIEALWQELEREFGVRGVYVTPYPHFSYQVAAGYDFDLLAPVLRSVASTQHPFSVRTAGLGIFTGATPVLFMRVVRNAALSALHQRLWDAIGPLADAPQPFYASHRWIPHITLGFGDLTSRLVAQIAAFLQHRDLNWTVPVDALAVIERQAAGEQILTTRVKFGTNGGTDA